MNWLRNNWLKLIIALGVLIVSVSVSFYFAIFLPKQKKLETQLKNELLIKQQANELADDIFQKNLDCGKYDDKIKKEETGPFRMSVVSGAYYSAKMNSCFYVGLDWDDKIKIRNAQTGQDAFTEDLKDMGEGTVGEEIRALIEKSR